MSDETQRTKQRHTMSEMLLQDKIRFSFTFVLLALFAFTAYESSDFQPLARYLPFTASLVAIAMLIFSLITDVGTFRRQGKVAQADTFATSSMALAVERQELVADDAEAGAAELSDVAGPMTEKDAIRQSAAVMGWILGYFVGIALVGLMIATPLYLGLYLHREAKASRRLNVIGNVAVFVGLSVMREALNLEWPPYLLRDVLDGVMSPVYNLGETLLSFVGL